MKMPKIYFVSKSVVHNWQQIRTNLIVFSRGMQNEIGLLDNKMKTIDLSLTRMLDIERGYVRLKLKV